LRRMETRRGVERLFRVRSQGVGYYRGLVGADACVERPGSCELPRGIEVDDAAGTVRFHLTEPGARVMVLFAATLMDALIFERLAVAFDVHIDTLSLGGLITRAALNAALGGVIFFYVDRHLGRRKRP